MTTDSRGPSNAITADSDFTRDIIETHVKTLSCRTFHIRCPFSYREHREILDWKILWRLVKNDVLSIWLSNGRARDFTFDVRAFLDGISSFFPVKPSPSPASGEASSSSGSPKTSVPRGWKHDHCYTQNTQHDCTSCNITCVVVLITIFRLAF